MDLLEVRDIYTYYGDMCALHGVSFTVGRGEIITLIGANGAGKTSTLNTICGILKPRQGRILLDGKEIQNLPAHRTVAAGMSLVSEGHQVFPRLTVLENLEMGAFIYKDKRRVAEQLERVFAIFPRLKERKKTTRRNSQWWRATDVIYWPCADGSTAYPSPGRAFFGAIPAAR